MAKRNRSPLNGRRSPSLVLLLALTSILMATLLIAAACASPTPDKGAQIIDTLAPALNPAWTALAGTPTALPTPRLADLKATVMAGLPPTPTPDSSSLPQPGEIEIAILPLDLSPEAQPLWAVYSLGMAFDAPGMGFHDPDQGHFVALYTHDDAGWRQLDRVLLASCAEYVNDGALAQMEVAPGGIWLEHQSAAGAHSGCYDLLSYDGHALALEASNANSNPGAGWLVDLDADGWLEVVLDHSDYYVFCYACGMRWPRFQILRWDGERLVRVDLQPLAGSAPEEARRLNDRAVELASAGLWKQAQSAISEALGLDLPAKDLATTLKWNAAFIDLHAEAAAAQTEKSAYPLLAHVFYGDYVAAVDQLRPHSLEEIWGPHTPVFAGTMAEGWEFELSRWLLQMTNAALQVEPDLAPAYFLRGWATHLGSPGDPLAVADVERAAELAPKDSLFAESALYLQVPISPGPPKDTIVTPTATPQLASGAAPVRDGHWRVSAEPWTAASITQQAE